MMGQIDGIRICTGIEAAAGSSFGPATIIASEFIPDQPDFHAKFLIAITTLIENPITIDRTLLENFSSNPDVKISTRLR